MNDWTKLDVILQKFNDCYINDHGVLFHRLMPGFMLVNSPWPGFNANKINLNYLCNDAAEFITRLKIDNVGQIDKVRQDILLQLFFEGEVILNCGLNKKNVLEFQFNDGNLIANRSSSDLAHIVKKSLKHHRDFIEYTKKYFSKTKTDSVRRN